MKKLTLSLILVITCYLITNAQVSVTPEPGEFGIKIGYGAVLTNSETTVVGNENNFLIYEVSLETSRPALQIGAFAHKKIGYLWVEADLFYTSYSNEFKVRSYLGDVVETSFYDESFKYVDFQVLAGIHANNFRLGVGPVAHILASHDDGLSLPGVYNARTRPLSFGFAGNVGYDWGNFKFDVKFENSFRSVGDHIYYGETRSKFKGTPDMVILNVGYRLF